MILSKGFRVGRLAGNYELILGWIGWEFRLHVSFYPVGGSFELLLPFIRLFFEWWLR